MEPRTPESGEQVMQRLRRLMRDQPEIEGAAVITSDGMPIASIMPLGMDEDRLNHVLPMVANCTSLAANLVNELNQPGLANLFIRSAAGYVVVIALGVERLLNIICNPVAKNKFPEFPLAPSLVPVFPWYPPGRLNAHAKPEYPDDDDTP